MDATEELFKRLTEAEAISGFEGQVAGIIQQELRGLCQVRRDNLGSVICEHRGESDTPKVMIAAHMDEVGFIVKEVTDEGFVKFLPVGGWWPGNMLAQRVAIMTRKGRVVGTIGSKPIHDMEKDKQDKCVKIKDMFIDVGASAGFDVKAELDIRPGDPITPVSEFEVMSNPKMYMAKAWDDRIGVAIMIESMRRLSSMSHPSDVFGVGTVQEEVGLRGAQTSASFVGPDVAFGVDVCAARDTSSETKGRPERLGNGVGIMVFDNSLLPNVRLRDFMIDIAERKGIKYFLGILDSGGTDAGRIQLNLAGVPTLYIGIASRYIHSHISIVHRDDFENAVKLMVEACLALDAEAVGRLKEF